MEYVNVGAATRNGVAFPTKKALKTALKEDPSEVLFTPTSTLGPWSGQMCGDDLPRGYTLSVCGPDPHTHRAWFASVQWTATGPKCA
jgi:hypothetical protein